MFRKEWQKVLAGILIALLFGMILLTAYHFVREPEVVDIEDTTKKEEKPSVTFQNLSSMSEADIREMAEEKRVELQSYLGSYPSYKVSEAFKDYTEEDDLEYMGIGEDYLNGLHKLITDDFYNEIFSKLQLADVKDNVTIAEKVYVAPINLFDEYYFSSAISQSDYNQEELILKKATDDKIEMTENLKYCREDLEDVCMRNDFYDYVLDRVENEFKIAKIH